MVGNVGVVVGDVGAMVGDVGVVVGDVGVVVGDVGVVVENVVVVGDVVVVAEVVVELDEVIVEVDEAETGLKQAAVLKNRTLLFKTIVNDRVMTHPDSIIDKSCVIRESNPGLPLLKAGVLPLHQRHFFPLGNNFVLNVMTGIATKFLKILENQL